MEPERPWTLETAVAETRVEVGTLRRDVDRVATRVDENRTELQREIGALRAEVRADIGELRQDFRRLDDRFFQMLLLQVGTLVAALASVAAAIVT